MEAYLIVQVTLVAIWFIYKGVNIKDDTLS